MTEQEVFESVIKQKAPLEIDLMSDELTWERFRELELQGRTEYEVDLELKMGLKYGLLALGMIAGAAGKPKQGILLHRLEESFKKLSADFPPDYKTIRVVIDRFCEEVGFAEDEELNPKDQSLA